MVTLLRWAFWLCALCALGWFAATVELGDRTLIQHLRAIAQTREARSLAAGTRDQAARVAERVRRGLGPDEEPSASPPPGADKPPVEQLDDKDRRELDRVLRERTQGRPPRGSP